MAKGNNAGVWVAVVGGVLGVSALAAYVQLAPAKRIPPGMERQEAPEQKPKDSPKVVVMQKVTVVLPEMQGDNMTFRKETFDVPDDLEAKKVAVEEYLKRSKIAPSDTRLLQFEVLDGDASLIFNDSFRAGYGSEEESMLLTGLCRTLGLFPDVRKVSFMVDGMPLESLGHIELLDGLKVIRDDEPNETRPSSARPEPPAN
ncbi:MAG: GerMN domain-containing protein [Fimbriimonadaceae bacterium]|nr:GerMN domain-containing protein [Fimbriimonadaceae bacterium]